MKKKSNAIAYHYGWESAAMGETIHGYIHTSKNVADILTKSLSSITRRKHFESIMYDVTQEMISVYPYFSRLNHAELPRNV